MTGVLIKNMENEPIFFITYRRRREPYEIQGTGFASAHKMPDIFTGY